MKERPILFKGRLVRAILEGRKTVTRRVVTRQHATEAFHAAALNIGVAAALDTMPDDVRRPYGVAGDRLWVRETWYDDFGRKPGEAHALNVERNEDGGVEGIEYRATHACAAFEAGCPCNPDGDGKRSVWRPSIFMPRWASRLLLEVASVRVERLRDITEEDARAEGVEPVDGAWRGDGDVYPAARGAFRSLWDSINAARGYGWDANPWVWRIEFARIAPREKPPAPAPAPFEEAERD